MKFEVIEILMLLGSGQGVILAFAFLTKQSRYRFPNLLFAIALLIVAYELFLYAFMKSGNIIRILPSIVGTSFPISFLIAPLYYFYVRGLVEGGLRLRLYDLLHLAPCIYMIRESLPFILSPNSVKIGYVYSVYFNNKPRELSDQVLFYVWLNLAVMIIYFYFAQRSILKKEHEIGLVSADAGTMEHLIQLRKLTIGYGLYVLGFGVVATSLSILKSYGVIIDAYWMIFKSMFIYAIGYHNFQAGARSFPIHMDHAYVHTGKQSEFEFSEHNEKYRKSGLSMDQANYYYAKLCGLMEIEQVYLESELRLSTLAETLTISPNQLSQIINQCAQKSFYDFVNEYRINHAKQLLKSETKKTVLDIALSVGFNNKATFNRVFKQHTQMTPTSFSRQGS